MLGGFDPRLGEMFLRRRRGTALVWGLLALGLLGGTAWVAYPPPKEEVAEVQLEPEIQDFAIEEEPEPEIEEEPPPPPPPNTKVKVVKNPKPRPKPKPPDKKVTDAAEESDAEKTVEVGAGAGTSPGGMGTKPKQGPPKAVQPKPKPEAPKPKPKPKASKPKIDPTQPVDRPENATAPKPLSSNASPVYPKELRDKGVTGKVVIKLHVHRDGTVRGAKILRKSNNATTDEDKDRASKLFVSAVAKAIKSWKFEPAKLGGEPITVWHTVTIPFTLSAG